MGCVELGTGGLALLDFDMYQVSADFANRRSNSKHFGHAARDKLIEKRLTPCLTLGTELCITASTTSVHGELKMQF